MKFDTLSNVESPYLGIGACFPAFCQSGFHAVVLPDIDQAVTECTADRDHIG